jgi:mono/diheme cytochrome c family protein
LVLAIAAHQLGALPSACAQTVRAKTTARPGAVVTQQAATAAARAALELFKQNCIQCHGLDGKGEAARSTLPVIPNFTDQAWQQEHTDAQLTVSILEGKGRLMPSWAGRLNDKQAADLVKHVVRGFGPARQTQEVATTSGDFESQFSKLRAQQVALAKQFRDALRTPVNETRAPIRKSSQMSKNADLGRELFTGEKQLANGGPACIWCHTANGNGRLGGKLGPDLTKACDRAGGAEALAAQLHQSHAQGSISAPSGDRGIATAAGVTRTEVQRATLAVYRQHTLRGDEVLALAAYLEKGAKEGSELISGPHLSFLLIALGGSVLCLGMFDLLRKGSARFYIRPQRSDVAARVGDGSTPEQNGTRADNEGVATDRAKTRRRAWLHPSGAG